MTPATTIQTPVEQLFSIKTAADVQSLLNALPDANWRPLGDRANNYAPVNVGAEPADGWAEKVINGIDAIIENEVEVARDTACPTRARRPRSTSVCPAGTSGISHRTSAAHSPSASW